MVLLGGDGRLATQAVPNRENLVVLFCHRVAAGRQPQSAQAAAAQGQVRQQIEREQRGRVLRSNAVMLGEEGRGIRTIIEMAHATRLDFAIGSSGLIRQALSQAIHHTANRRAFQRALIDLPIMRNVAADLSIESEALMWMSLRLARALDRAQGEPSEAKLSRIGTPTAKYWACKRAPQFVAETLECHGGNGFIADQLMERLYREAPLNGIWEGTGNVICLDVLRSMQREPETVSVFLGEVRKARGADR